jgi:hypothetical protein
MFLNIVLTPYKNATGFQVKASTATKKYCTIGAGYCKEAAALVGLLWKYQIVDLNSGDLDATFDSLKKQNYEVKHMSGHDGTHIITIQKDDN